MIIKKLTITITKMILITRLSLQGITSNWLVPNYAAWWQRYMCVNNLPRVALIGKKPRFELSTYWSQVQRPKIFGVCEATKQHTHRHDKCSLVVNNHTVASQIIFTESW